MTGRTPPGSRDQTTSRLAGLDIARGLAVLGMTIVNVRLVAGLGSDAEPGWLRIAVGMLDGRAAATFVVLAGMGTSLLTRRGRSNPAVLSGQRGRLRRRAVFLAVLGLAFWWLWPPDILHYYGAYLAIGALLAAAPRWVVAAVAVASSMVGWGWVAAGKFFENWDLNTLDYQGFWTVEGFIRNLLLDGFHPLAGWLALYLAGMLLGRLDLGARRTWLGLVGCGAVALAVSAAVSWIVCGPPGGPYQLGLGRWSWITLVEPLPPSAGYLVTGLGAAAVTIGTCLFAAEQLPGVVRETLAAAGRQSLTLYLAHVIVLMGALETTGHLTTASLSLVLMSSTVFWAGGAVAARLWERRLGRGPIEILMRRVSG